jgi:hypothetical protein
LYPALAAIGIYALVRRRIRVAQKDLEPFSTACASCEKAYSDLILAAEELGGQKGSDLQLRAADLKKRIDALVGETSEKPSQKNDPVVLGRLRQFENELLAVRSSVTQQQNH